MVSASVPSALAKAKSLRWVAVMLGGEDQEHGFPRTAAHYCNAAAAEIEGMLNAAADLSAKQSECSCCCGGKPMPTDGGGELEMVQIIPLPAINLTTWETEKCAAPPFYALQFNAFDGELEDHIPIRYCPLCGRNLTEVTADGL